MTRRMERGVVVTFSSQAPIRLVTEMVLWRDLSCTRDRTRNAQHVSETAEQQRGVRNFEAKFPVWDCEKRPVQMMREALAQTVVKNNAVFVPPLIRGRVRRNCFGTECKPNRQICASVTQVGLRIVSGIPQDEGFFPLSPHQDVSNCISLRIPLRAPNVASTAIGALALRGRADICQAMRTRPT